MTYGDAAGVVKMLLDPLLANCRAQWTAHVNNNFDSEGGMVGGWDALSPRTKELRMQLGYPPEPILKMSGALSKSFDVQSSGYAPQASVELNWGSRRGDGLKTWNGESLAALHHYGGTGVNPLTGERFPVGPRKLYDESTLEKIFVNTVEMPFNSAIKLHLASMLGGKT